MSTFNSERTTRLSQLMRGIMADMQQVEIDRIKVDPKRHKLTTIMAEGKPASWRWIQAGKDGRGTVIRFCWACHRNAAGYFLLWREKHLKDGTIKRDSFLATPSKADAKDTSFHRRDRWRATR